MRYLFLMACWCVCAAMTAQPSELHNLTYKTLPTRWDEALPLGNGMLGALIWQSGSKLRISIDRADVWDLRPMAGIDKYRHADVVEAVEKGDLSSIYAIGDIPYDTSAGPTKLPVAALEFDIEALGPLKSVELDIQSAKCFLHWKSGAALEVFVHATEPTGWYLWTGLTQPAPSPVLVRPAYDGTIRKVGNEVVDGMSLARLGYRLGNLETKNGISIYTQPTYDTDSYQVALGSWHWQDEKASTWQGSHGGVWSVSSRYGEIEKSRPDAQRAVANELKNSFESFWTAHKSHIKWWQDYWMASQLDIPDAKLERQYYLDMYKFGCVARKGAPPISLQGIWTADNGQLPPWKGDLHHDLNTQLSYWPAYVSNHLSEAESFSDWLWGHRDDFRKYAKQVFGTDGLNVPGVSTLTGQPMGGWHMYSLSPTVAAWLTQHMYWQWTYSQDSVFLREQLIPWVKDVSAHMEAMLISGPYNRVLALSSSPEFHDNDIKAWYPNTLTSYDAALYRYVNDVSIQLGLGPAFKPAWESMVQPPVSSFAGRGLDIAKDEPYAGSHRHFSHLLALHPLGVYAPQPAGVMTEHFFNESIGNLEKYGASGWTGYSHAWLANLYARNHQGDKAAQQLRNFTDCYCSPNSFHLNGNQCPDRKDLSHMTYRPFTLEGNFAAAAGLQAMLFQSYNGVTQVFPAMPADWTDATFQTFRAEGGFLVSAVRSGGQTERIEIEATCDGRLLLAPPFRTHIFENNGTTATLDTRYYNTYWAIQMKKGEKVRLINGYE